MLAHRLARFAASTWALLGALACAPPPAAPAPSPAPTPSAPARPLGPAPLTGESEPPLTELRTGRISPIDHAEPLTLTVRRHGLDGDEQLLEIVLPEFASESPGDLFWFGTEARLTGSSAPFQLVGRGKGGEMLLWLRRPKSESAGEIAGDAYTPAVGAQPGHHFRFRAAAPSGAASSELVRQWAAAAAEYLSSQPGTFGTAAAARLHARYKLSERVGAPPSFGDPGGDTQSLANLMETFSGRSAVQAALAVHRSAIMNAARQPRTIPLSQLKGPELRQHPWPQLLARLGTAPPAEPLARAIPAEFYYLRAKSFAALRELVSFVESFGAPAADLFDGSSSERRSLPRYLAELGVETGDLSRVLGPEVVEEIAVTGSDPYVHVGSDVTLVFRLKSPLLFRAALAKALGTHGAAHGGTRASTFTHEGVTVEVFRSADGRVRQHRASVQELELVSNSPAAIRRVISATLAKAPRLADEADFQYMLARDATVAADLLAFIGDRFVARVVGPAQKVAEMRRQVALAELSAPPTAALLYGWIHGRSPSNGNELVRSGLLAAAELKHHDGARIDWSPGVAPRSVFGTPAALEPLLDSAPVLKVSPVEREAYARFAQQYEWRWGEYIDPIALRVTSRRQGDRKNLHAEIRVLPLVPAESASRYDIAGEGRVMPSELSSGARLTLAIGQHAYLRQALERVLGSFASDRGLKLDWLGDYALAGIADRGELLAAWRSSRETRDLPLERPAAAGAFGRSSAPASRMGWLAGFPAYGAIGLRSRAAAVVALTLARQWSESAAPGALSWAPHASHRGVEVVRILSQEAGQEVALYYALAGDVLLASLNRSVLRALIDQALDGKLPSQNLSSTQLAAEGQVVLELAPLKRGALRSLIASGLGLASLAAAPRARAAAEAVLRGVPESAHEPDRSAELSLAYLGTLPLTPDGGRYALAAEGITDPLRGSAHAPEWPALPAPGSPSERLLGAFGRLRSDLSFDEEPVAPTGTTSAGTARPNERLRSLRVRLDLTLR